MKWHNPTAEKINAAENTDLIWFEPCSTVRLSKFDRAEQASLIPIMGMRIAISSQNLV